MRFLTHEIIHTRSGKTLSVYLVYKNDDPKKHVFDPTMKALGVFLNWEGGGWMGEGREGV